MGFFNVSSGGTSGSSDGYTKAEIDAYLAAKVPYDSMSSDVRVINDAGRYSSSSASATGAIKITIPNTITANTMFRMRVEGCVISSAVAGWTFNIEAYLAAQGTTWNAPKALLTPNSPTDTVRFGHDGTSLCILLGTSSTVWTYPKVYIPEIIVGYSGRLSFPSKLSMSLISDETGITFTSGTVRTLATTTSTLATGSE